MVKQTLVQPFIVILKKTIGPHNNLNGSQGQ